MNTPNIKRTWAMAGLVFGLGLLLPLPSIAGSYTTHSEHRRFNSQSSRYYPSAHESRGRKDINHWQSLSSFRSWDQEGRRLATWNDFENLRQGDQVSSWCPKLQARQVETVRQVDRQGRARFTETRNGMKMNGCNIILRSKSGSREVDSVMVCPDGSIARIECHKL